ncbi:Arylsulfatase [Rubripirellula obstinata]|uniref:Arylsulfatase n=1 Tax=Rubripirellula obstinata TaxID=406547 RepID=A0A5B1C9X5_9BACT|nr:arylsulfatase [Rubripirellula obstinata]KAA1257938.1 Arylsulfatase [Rubripirellula obstinata]
MPQSFLRLLLALATITTPAILFAADRPNVLVIMADDLGFSDVGCYGGEIETPNLDALAGGGLRFSQFYNTAKCHSSRVSLLTGQYCLAAGDVSLAHAVTSAEVLRDSGYYTAMSGKWHLDKQPTDFGFNRYFGHLSGASNYFHGNDTFRLDGEPWPVPKQGFYTTVAKVDFGLQFLKDAGESQKPWYLYVAFNAPHEPLQALPSDYEKYEGRYDAGWDTVRHARLNKQKKLGLLASDLKPSPRPEHIPAWDTLSKKRQRFESKRMTTLAAMIDRLDQEIGRLVQHLKDTDQLDNTMILFVSDNGACPYDRWSHQIDKKPTNGSIIWGDSTGWAWARNSPFRYYKQNQFEGGISTPAILHWPAGLKIKPGEVNRQPVHLIDVMPTLADITDSPIPSDFANRELRPVSGQSLRPIFDGESFDRQQPLHFLFSTDRGLRIDDWKLVSFRSGPWELYDLKNDRSELNNLAASEPERLQSMIDTWTKMAADVLHAKGKTISPVATNAAPHRHPEWTNFALDPVAGIRGSATTAARDARPPKRDPSKSKPVPSLRARKNTKIEVQNNQLQLTFNGDDPGIAMDRLPAHLPAGPYVLRFGLNSSAIGDGEVYFTTDAKIPLNKGTQIPIPVTRDGNWQEHVIKIPTTQQLNKLRLDVSDGKGQASIRGLHLTNESNKTLMSWP